MSAMEAYVASLVEDNLGLVSGSVEPDEVADIADEFAAFLRGQGADSREPVLEKRLMAFLQKKERSELESTGLFVRKLRWPNGSPFAVCLTHDVDNVERPLAHVLKTRSRFETSDLVREVVGVSSLYDNIEEIAKREDEKGFRSSFYLLTSNYPLEEMAAEIKMLMERGWDIGLHGDFGTHDSLEKMKAAVEVFSNNLGFPPSGVREHFLRFEFGKTWEIMEAAEFDYDTTVGFNDRLGFRLGLATPFHPPDSAWNAMRLLEIPLVLMDTTLWGYLKRDEEAGMKDIKSMLSRVQEVGGLFSLLWHQEAVKMKGGKLYWSLLDEFKKLGCFVGSAAQIAQWWRARSSPMVREGNTVRIAGLKGLPLVLDAKTGVGRKVEVSGGHLAPTDGRYYVRAEGAELTVKVT